MIKSEVIRSNTMLCAKVGSRQFCILYTGSLREETPCCKMSAVCIPRESVGVEENFQMLHASVRETRKLPSPKLSTGKHGNKEINRLGVWCNVLYFCFGAPEEEANPPNFPA